MARRNTLQQMPSPRVIHYVDPSTPAELAYPMNPARLAAKQQQDRQLYAQWKVRQLAAAERERKFRRFWLGFGAVIALGVLAALVLVGWLLWQFLASLNLGVLALPLVAVLAVGTAVGGHHCVTTVTHRH